MSTSASSHFAPDSDRLPKIGPKECVSHRPKQPAVSSWPGLDLPDEEGG
jgi:hypothetical protein